MPKEFTAENKIEKIQGVYVPFYLFDVTANIEATFAATRSISRKDRDYVITDTSHYSIHRHGNVPFVHIPQDASVNMPNSHMDAIEPFDYSKIQPFSTAYLPGYLAEKQSVSKEDCLAKIEERTKNSAIDSMYRTIQGYDSCTMLNHKINYRYDKTHYALLPVYLLSTKYKDENYLFAMNGQTGKFIGNLPIDQSKYWTHFIKIFVCISLVTLLVFLFMTGGF